MALPINQFKSTGNTVSATEYNELVTGINDIYAAQLINVNTINGINNTLNAFKILSTSGLSFSYKGGLLKRISDGIVLNIPDGTIFVEPNITNGYAFINRSGNGVTSTSLPIEAYDLVMFTSNATAITSIIDIRSRSFEIKQRQFRKVVHANKNASQILTSGGAFNTVNGWQTSQNWQSNENGAFSGAGIYTIPVSTQAKIFARVFLESIAPTDLSAKLSLFVGATELRILEEKPTSTNALRTTLQGWHTDNFTAGNQISIRVAIGSGSNVNMPATNNTELVIELLG